MGRASADRVVNPAALTGRAARRPRNPVDEEEIRHPHDSGKPTPLWTWDATRSVCARCTRVGARPTGDGRDGVVSNDVLVCPNCRARVLGTWAECKFCGTTLRVDQIAATVHPDDLVAPEQPDRETSANAASGPRAPWESASGWSTWVGSDVAGSGPPPAGAPSAAPSGPGPFDRRDSGAQQARAVEGGPDVVPDAFPIDRGDGDRRAWTGGPGTGGSGTGTAGTGESWTEGPGDPSLAVGTGDDHTGSWTDAPGGLEGPGGQRRGDRDGWSLKDDDSSFLPDDKARAEPGDSGGGWFATATEGGRTDVTDRPDAQRPGGGDAAGSGALVPTQGSEATWLAGPAPTVEDDAGPTSAGSADRNAGPGEAGSGSAAADWYSESVGSADSETGLEPADWYTDTAATGETAVTGGSSAALEDRPPPPTTAPSEPDLDDGEHFDPEAIFRDPGPDVGGAVGEVGFAADDDESVNWQPAGPDVWDTPVEPTGKPKGQAILSRESRLLLLAIVFLLVVAVAVTQIRDRQKNYPAAWAPDVNGIASWVASERKLDFAHPVAVEALSSGAYDSAVRQAETPADADARQAIQQRDAKWRALGALSGAPAPALAIIAAQAPSNGAFYNPMTNKLVLRRGTDSSQIAYATAGALSVALDDQHGDLSSLADPGIAENPLFAVVAGNADLIRSEYAASRPATERASLQRLAQVAPKDGFLAIQRDMQTRLGRSIISLVHDVKGNDAANALTKDPPASSQQVMYPLTFLDGQGPLTGTEPEAPANTETLESGTLGAQSWYLVVAERLDPAPATTLAKLWAGDHFVTYRKTNGTVCLTDVIRIGDPTDTATVTTVLNRWADTIPDHRVTVSSDGGNLVTVAGCDPGAAAHQGVTHSAALAAKTATVRSDLAAGYYRKGTKIPNGPNGPIFTPKVAWCVADNAVANARPDDLDALVSQKGPVYEQLTKAAGVSCDTHMVDQLFTATGS